MEKRTKFFTSRCIICISRSKYTSPGRGCMLSMQIQTFGAFFRSTVPVMLRFIFFRYVVILLMLCLRRQWRGTRRAAMSAASVARSTMRWWCYWCRRRAASQRASDLDSGDSITANATASPRTVVWPYAYNRKWPCLTRCSVVLVVIAGCPEGLVVGGPVRPGSWALQACHGGGEV
jgi:hypothetical protein